MTLYAAIRLPVRPLAKVFKALGDDTRLKILALLANGELCVCHIEEALGLSQPSASRHLGILRAAGLLETRRQGTWIHYRLATPSDHTVARMVDEITRRFGDGELKGALAKLTKSVGPDGK